VQCALTTAHSGGRTAFQLLNSMMMLGFLGHLRRVGLDKCFFFHLAMLASRQPGLRVSFLVLNIVRVQCARYDQRRSLRSVK
jgi:hypothetical protein